MPRVHGSLRRGMQVTMNDQMIALFGSAVGMLPTAPGRSLQMFSEITAIDEISCDGLAGSTPGGSAARCSERYPRRRGFICRQ